MTPVRHLVCILLAATIVFASAPVVPVRGMAPTPEPVTVTRDIPYVTNAGPHQTLDLYLPSDTTAAGYPLVVWVHGGGWRRGDKEAIRVEYLLDEGYAIASLNYRLSSEAIFPAQIQDVNEALSFLWHHAAEYHLDQDRFAVGGASAGGHLATLAGLSANERPPDFSTDPDVRIAAILDFFGPTDLTVAGDIEEEPGAVTGLLGGTVDQEIDLARAASPVTYVDSADPPVLMLQGTDDPIVPASQSQLLASALDDANVEHVMILVPGGGHGGPGFRTPAVQEEVIAFLAGAFASD